MNMPSPIILRPAIEADIPVLRELYRRTIKTVNSRDYTPDQVEAWAGTADRTDSLRHRLATQHFIVATRDGDVVGFASIDLEEAYLDLLYVDADHQRLGIGRLLGEAMLDAAHEANIQRVEVHASVTARPLFEALGFSYVADQFPEIDGVTLANFVMSIELGRGVRPMTRADLPAVEALDAAIFAGESYGPYTWRQLFDLHAPSMFVAESDEEPRTLEGFAVGAVASDGVGWFLALGVALTARGRGIGAALARRTVLKLESRGAPVIRLTVAADNAPARALYTALGFHDGWHEPDYYGPGRDRLVMVREPRYGI